jgi:type I restriction enzyme M protein
MLLESYQYVQRSGGDARTLKLYGQEKNLTTSSISRINLFLHAIQSFQIIRGDTLKEPSFLEGDRLAQFDVVIANPPFSLEKWGHENWSQDPYGRNIAGTPPKSNGDYAWVQHMIASMAPSSGRMAIVLPHGALFRQGAEGTIRKALIEKDLLEAVIGLGPNLFYGTGISACILVFRAKKIDERKNKVLFIDASEQYLKGRNQNLFLPEHAEAVLKWYEDFGNIENISQVVELSEIRENEFNLNIPLYVKKVHEAEEIDLKATLEQLKKDYAAFLESEEKMKRLLKEVNIL